VILQSKKKYHLHFTDGSYEVPSTMSKEAIEDEARLTGMLDDLSKLVDNLEPWKCARAEEFDAISVQAWFESVGALSSTIQGFSAFFRCILALDMIDVSLLYLLHYFVTGGEKPSSILWNLLTSNRGLPKLGIK
jgi:hypothetical protein